MRQSVLGTTALLLVAGFLLFWPGISFAVPAPGPDCGAGASIVGSDTAGKVTLGTGSSGGTTGARAATCTLTFSSAFANAPSCMAMNETNTLFTGKPAPTGARATTTELVINGGVVSGGFIDGDVLSYLCVSY